MDDSESAAALRCLLRTARTSFDNSPALYVNEVVDALEEHGVDVFDTSSTPVGASPRARAIWFTEGSLARAEWYETHGWTTYGRAYEEPVQAPLAIVAAPSAVAAWIVDVLAGRPRTGPVARIRTPTLADRPGPTGLAFERQLLSFRSDEEEQFLPRLVPAPPSPRLGMTWTAPLMHQCLSCPAEEGNRPWTRKSATHFAKVAMSGRTRTVYTGWCLTCHPDQLHMTQDERDLLDSDLVRAHERGRFPGTLLLSGSVEKYICTVCLNSWWLFPGASLPLTHGVLDDIGLRLHPCPWCWEADEELARTAQDQSLLMAW